MEELFFMESPSKPKTILRKSKAKIVTDNIKSGEGRFFITLGKNTSVQIGDVRMHVVKANYNERGVSQFRLMFVGPKTTKINRINRDELEASEPK